MTTTQYEVHPFAEIFPEMTDDEFQRLCDDMRQNGQLDEIILLDNKILDGRNRYNACRVLRLEPLVKTYDKSISPINFVISKNLERRMLDASQRALIAARLANMRQGERTDLSQNCGKLSQADAAKMLNVSPRLVSSAAQVEANGISALTEMVERGDLSVSAAANLAQLPKGKQMRLVTADRKELIKLANPALEKTIERANSTSDICLLCNSTLEANPENLLTMLYAMADDLTGDLARYVEAIIEEINSEYLAPHIRSKYEFILEAVRNGHSEERGISKATGYPLYVLRYALICMVDGGSLEIIDQGGKTHEARGRTKNLYRAAEKKETPFIVPPDCIDRTSDIYA